MSEKNDRHFESSSHDLKREIPLNQALQREAAGIWQGITAAPDFRARFLAIALDLGKRVKVFASYQPCMYGNEGTDAGASPRQSWFKHCRFWAGMAFWMIPQHIDIRDMKEVR